MVINDPIRRTTLLATSATPFLVPDTSDLRLDICKVHRGELVNANYDELMNGLPLPVKVEEEPVKEEEDTPLSELRRHSLQTTATIPATDPTTTDPTTTDPTTTGPTSTGPTTTAPTTTIEPRVCPFLVTQNPDARAVAFAACTNGTVCCGSSVVWEGALYRVQELGDNGQWRAIAHLHRTDDEEIQATVPCSLLALQEYRAPTPPAVLPTCSADLVQLAYAVVKENLLHLEARHRQRPTEAFDVMEYRQVFAEAFGIKKGRESVYLLEMGETSKWDRIFGARWDVVVSGEYLVVKIAFKREKIGRNFSVSEKLRCNLSLINVDCSGDYRKNGHARLMDKYRIVNVPAEDLQSVFTTSVPSSNPTVASHEQEEHGVDCICPDCFS